MMKNGLALAWLGMATVSQSSSGMLVSGGKRCGGDGAVTVVTVVTHLPFGPSFQFFPSVPIGAIGASGQWPVRGSWSPLKPMRTPWAHSFDRRQRQQRSQADFFSHFVVDSHMGIRTISQTANGSCRSCDCARARLQSSVQCRVPRVHRVHRLPQFELCRTVRTCVCLAFLHSLYSRAIFVMSLQHCVCTVRLPMRRMRPEARAHNRGHQALQQ